MVSFHYSITNTGNCPIYFPWYSAYISAVHDSSAPNSPAVVEDMNYGNVVVLLNPGETYTDVIDRTVTTYYVELGSYHLNNWGDAAWYYDENGAVKQFIVEAGGIDIPLTYPDGEGPEEPRPGLALIEEGDKYYKGGNGSETPTTEDTFAPDDSVFVNHTVINSGNVPLMIVRYHETVVDGVSKSDKGKYEPGESFSVGTGRWGIGTLVEPGTETEELMGTATISFYYVGYDPDTYVNVDNGNRSAHAFPPPRRILSGGPDRRFLI